MSRNRFDLQRRLIAEARPYWTHLIGILFLNVLATPLALLTPIPLKLVVDNVLGSQPLPEFLRAWLPSAFVSGTALLIACTGLLVGLACLEQVRELIASLARTYTGARLVLAFRAKLFRHAQRLSVAYHDTKGSTDSTYRIQYDAPAIEWILIDGISPFVTAALTLVGIVYVTAAIDWQLALVAIAIAPLLWFISRAYSHRLRHQWGEAYNLQSSAMSVVQEVLSAVRVVKAFGQEEREHQRFMHHSNANLWARMGIALDEGRFGVLVGLTIAAGTAAVLFIGTHHVMTGTLTLGGLLMVMTYLAQLYGPLQTLSSMTAHMQSSLASAERAFSLLDEVADVVEKKNPIRIQRSAGAVVFEDVSFGYEGNRRILAGVGFEIQPGSRVGLTGVTGAGKTTLVSLLTRFYDPTAGRILLDGVDLRDYHLADLRNQFSIVLQEPVLFSTTIAENIAYARPGASEDEIVAAARAANAHDFIRRLPHGYGTLVGERGMRLSGGERQRISLARAFLKDSPILILDEPTSSVDVKTEALIVEATERLMRGRTTFVITHRRTLLKYCSRELVVENGRVRDDMLEKQAAQA